MRWLYFIHLNFGTKRCSAAIVKGKGIATFTCDSFHLIDT